MSPDARERVPNTSLDVRSRLVEALRLDLVGPWPGHELQEERLPGWVRPSNWYLTGFLIPSGKPPEKAADADEGDEIGEAPESAGLAEESNEERRAAKKSFFASSARGQGADENCIYGCTWRRTWATTSPITRSTNGSSIRK